MKPTKTYFLIAIPLNTVFGLLGTFLMIYGLLFGVYFFQGSFSFLIPGLFMILYLFLIAALNKLICNRCFRNSQTPAPDWYSLVGSMITIVVMFALYAYFQAIDSFSFVTG